MIIGHRRVDAGRILGIVTGDDLQDFRRIGHGAGHGTGLVQGGAVGDEAAPRDAPVAGFQAHDAAEAGGLADGAARVRSDGGETLPRRHAGRRAAAGAARNPVTCPRDFLVTLKAEFSVDEPMANSSMFALPRMMAPASLSLATQWAS